MPTSPKSFSKTNTAPSRTRGPNQRHNTRGAFTKTTVRLPEPVAARLRAWASDTGRTYADAVLSSYLEGIEDLRGRCTADAQRIRLGLRPLNAPRPVVGPRVPIVFRASTAALAELGNAAASLAMSRTDLAVVLLDLYLPTSR